jgi:hypothetical protein
MERGIHPDTLLLQDRLLKREAQLRNLSIEELNVHINKKLFAMIDEVLDRAENGPAWLRQPAIAEIMKRPKGYAAREGNKLLGLTRQTFWQTESFDDWPRDEDEFYRIVAYIENNPVKAGLARVAQDWPWSSACRKEATRVARDTVAHMSGYHRVVFLTCDLTD